MTLRDLRVRRWQNGIILDRVTGSRVFDNDCSFLSGWGIAMWRGPEPFSVGTGAFTWAPEPGFDWPLKSLTITVAFVPRPHRSTRTPWALPPSFMLPLWTTWIRWFSSQKRSWRWKT